MPTPFRISRFVEFADTDMAGIMHFSAFFRFMEGAEHALLRSLGFSVFTEVGERSDHFSARGGVVRVSFAGAVRRSAGYRRHRAIASARRA